MSIFNYSNILYSYLLKILIQEADLAVCDFTITKARESVVDFTMPFMNLGISILYLKPEDKKPELFAFLSPFSTDVWIYVVTAYLAVSVMFFIQARYQYNKYFL